ncbi:D-inositol-3-phosphate glycosyltransferase [bioreactor metagenome]|uniref:D-inositol-3-phosphate glycosyltransferase n=1 Tax=bioreactor metagenome TaxID=1076179 RepID=A0A645GID1_9ZZZZ
MFKQPNFIETNVADPPGARSKDIVFLGIIGVIKKIENLIQAVALSKVLMNGTSRLNIVGAPRTVRDVGYMDSLVALVKELKLEDKVNFLGAKFEREKEKILNDSYVLVLPSASENFGNVVVEAMAQSTPVIASTNTPWEILHDYNAGWWVDNSPASLAKTLDIALSLESAQYQAICRNAQRLLKEKYLIDTSKDNHWLHIYTNDDVQKDCDLS